MTEQRAKPGHGHGLATLPALQGDEQGGRIGQGPFQVQITSEDREDFRGQRQNAQCGGGMRHLGVSRQTIWQRLKRGELDALHLRQGQRKGLRIKVVDHNRRLYE